MAGSVSDDYGSERSFEGFLSGQNSHPVEALAEWRSREQVDNGTPSTLPAYWFSDNDDDSAPKPSELYGRHTWKIEKFSQNTKRELKSEVFDVGGYKWYILIYPQGCDVSNHLSLFLCVANYDKLLPGWSHFAQFTIVVVNSDPRKSKYSDTLHRFWKKEHDWGWKKYMELSKVQDGFIVADTLEIRAQVQVIREKAERPFRCLHRQYRRELARAYLTNVEQICRRLVEDKRAKLRKLINDRVRWLSFYTFWLGVDQSAKDLMSREKIDAIMRVVVKHLFVEKEVSSALIMDSLDSGMKALEAKSKSRQEKTNLVGSSETSAAFIWVEDDMFVLADDVLMLLERAALEPLPSKDDKGPQNNAKEGNSGEDFIKDSIEWNERRLTELGLKTIETFVLAHIYSEKIEVAYQEAIALKRQEELIREEEAAGQAEIEQKAKRKTAEKEKRFKKKTNKQQRSNRKGKYRGKDEKSDMELAQCITEKPIACEVVSDVSDRDDNVSEIVQLDVEATHSTNWDADTSGALCSTELCSRSSLRSLTWHDRKSPSSVDDSSSTCSTDSVLSVVMNGSCERKSTTNYRTKKLPNREKNRVAVEAREQINRSHENNCRLFDPALNAENWNDASKSSSSAEPEPKAVLSLKDHIEKLEQHFHKKGGFVTSQKELIVKGQANGDKLSKQTTATEASSPRNPTHNFASGVQTKWVPNGRWVAPISVGEENSSSLPAVTSTKHLPQTVAMTTPNAKKAITTKPVSMPVENPTSYQGLVRSTPPSSVSIVTDPRPTASLVSTVQTAPVVSRVQIAPSHSEFLSTGGQLGSDTLPAVQSFKPLLYSQPGALPLSLQNSAETDIGLGTLGFSFGSVTSEILHNQHQRAEASQGSASTAAVGSSLLNSSQNLDSQGPGNSILQADFTDRFNASVSTHRTQRAPLEEFPHLDIINYLFDDELGSSDANGSAFSQGLDGGFHHPSGHQLIFGNDTSTLVKMGSTVNGQFGHPMVYYDDKGQPFYGSFCSHMNGLADVALQVDFSLYGNGHFDRMIQNQWPLANGSNPYFLNDAYPFLTPEYSNLACVGGYTVFQSSSGH